MAHAQKKKKDGLLSWLETDAESMARIVNGSIYTWPLHMAWTSHGIVAGL